SLCRHIPRRCRLCACARRARGPKHNLEENPMDGTNGYNRELVENLLREVDRCDDELASLKGEYMQECKGPREEIDEIKSRAKEAGVPTRVFSTLIKNRRLDKQA